MKVLLSSVFGPYGVDDAYGRKENLMEFLHNQVTREQDLFSLRFNHPSFGLYFIAENIGVPAAVLDFPTEKRFIQEIKKGYDYVGISFIMPNFLKAKRMADLVREHAPESRIVLGGHGTSIPDVENLIEHDHICRGEGVKWFRKLLGENPDRPFSHPNLASTFGRRVMGAPMKSETAILIPGVGCPNGCRFCCTTHFFGKEYTPYFETGQELFDVCLQIEKELGFTEFGIMDENFLKYPKRAHELLHLMEKHDKHYRFSIFSSAETVAEAGVEFLARLGVTFLWIGVESKFEMYEKNKGIELKPLIHDLRDHGISVLASAILFLEQHDKESIWEDIRFAVGLETDLVQFMQLGPSPGTALYRDYEKRNILRKDIPYEEWHGQDKIWFDHPNFSLEDSNRILREAFRYDYDRQGASLLRIFDTTIRGYKTLARFDDPYMAKRRELMKQCATRYRPALAALKRFAHSPGTLRLTEEVAAKYEQELGPMSIKQRVLSTLALAFARREAARVSGGTNTYQPRIKRTRYRMSTKDLVVEALRGKKLSNRLKLDIKWGQTPVLVTLEGILDKVNARLLGMKIGRYLRKNGGELLVKLDHLITIEDGALTSLLKRIRHYQGRARIFLAEEAETVREAIARLPESLKWLVVTDRQAPGLCRERVELR